MGKTRKGTFVPSLFLALGALLLASGLHGDEKGTETKPPDRQAREALEAATDRAIERGLAFIASQQNPAGYWEESEYALAVSGMAGLALLGHGHPARGRFAPHLRKYTNFLLRQIAMDGYITRAGEDRRAYGHAFSLLFLSQIYGMLDGAENKRVQKAIRDAVTHIETQQQPEGCWFQDYAVGGHNQIVTISQVQALRAANSSGFRVTKKKVENAVRFIQGFSFTDSSLGRRASSLATILAAGMYTHPRLPQALAGLSKIMLQPATHRLEDLNFPIFTHMYGAQVMYFRGGDSWRKYYDMFRKYVLRNQQAYGKQMAYWPPYRNVHAFSPGRVYSTANICLILQMPKETIPFYQSVKSDIRNK